MADTSKVTMNVPSLPFSVTIVTQQNPGGQLYTEHYSRTIQAWSWDVDGLRAKGCYLPGEQPPLPPGSANVQSKKVVTEVPA